jgi:hypothetical protein
VSITPVTQVSPPRVRHQVREAFALMLFSAATSVGIAATLVLLAHWGR